VLENWLQCNLHLSLQILQEELEAVQETLLLDIHAAKSNQTAQNNSGNIQNSQSSQSSLMVGGGGPDGSPVSQVGRWSGRGGSPR
jgi:hypothetical protein